MSTTSFNHKLIVSSINNNYKFIFFGLILIIYFAWMDIALFIHLQRWSPDQPAEATKPTMDYTDNEALRANGTFKKVIQDKTQFKYNYVDPFSVFKPLSVKLIMIDHMTHYVHDILARYLEDTLHFTQIFPWITANLVSFAGLFLALVGSRMIISENLLYCRIGALLFELRNLADSLDGVVYRSRLRRFEMEKQSGAQIGVYQSNYGSLGYNVDVICDGLGGLFFCIAIFIKFLRHLPHRNSGRLLIRKCKPNTNKNNASNADYTYFQLENEALENMDYPIEMENPNQVSLSNRKILNNEDANELETVFNTNNQAFSTNQNNQPDFFQKRHVSSREVKLIVISFGLRLLFTGLIWDHYVHKYHDLLMVFSSNPNKRRMQVQAFKSIGMWLIMWFWRLGNACAILEHLVITTFFNKLWEYLVFTSVIGWAYLVILTLFTQIHYVELYESLNSFAALT